MKALQTAERRVVRDAPAVLVEPPGGAGQVSHNQLRVLNELIGRAQLADKLGKQFGGRRDIYSQAGYVLNPVVRDYLAQYERGDVARRVVDAYPNACWRQAPEVYDDEDPAVSTPFEKAWQDMLKTNRVFHYMMRADILAGIGSYGVLILGFADGKPLHTELKVKKGMELRYLQPYRQDQAMIVRWDLDTTSPRYAQPNVYTIMPGKDTTDASAQAVQSFNVHHTRVLHIAEGCMESDVFGTPRMRPVLNRLFDLEKTAAGSAEMFWRAGWPGLSIEAPADADIDPTELEKMDGEIANYFLGLQRYLRLVGAQAKSLSPNVQNPQPFDETILKRISAATGMVTP